MTVFDMTLTMPVKCSLKCGAFHIPNNVHKTSTTSEKNNCAVLFCQCARDEKQHVNMCDYNCLLSFIRSFSSRIFVYCVHNSRGKFLYRIMFCSSNELTFNGHSSIDFCKKGTNYSTILWQNVKADIMCLFTNWCYFTALLT